MVPHVETGAVVPHEDHGFGGLVRQAADGDLRSLALLGEFQGVRDQIDQHHAQHGPITGDHRQFGDVPVDVPALGLRRHLLNDFSHQVTQVHGGLAHFLAPHPREGQQVVDQHAHAAGRSGNRFDVPQVVLIEHRRSALLEQRQIAVDVAQRRAQIVRDRVGKGLQLLVLRGQFGRALGHVALQFLAVSLQTHDPQAITTERQAQQERQQEAEEPPRCPPRWRDGDFEACPLTVPDPIFVRTLHPEQVLPRRQAGIDRQPFVAAHLAPVLVKTFQSVAVPVLGRRDIAQG
ncbi:hypothetical protein Y695_01484 [Hydrogenophaga sp. T4]|nr:hypothetical protein Y695_01484 [Hydrogenophaga sp. T4]